MERSYSHVGGLPSAVPAMVPPSVTYSGPPYNAPSMIPPEMSLQDPAGNILDNMGMGAMAYDYTGSMSNNKIPYHLDVRPYKLDVEQINDNHQLLFVKREIYNDKYIKNPEHYPFTVVNLHMLNYLLHIQQPKVDSFLKVKSPDSLLADWSFLGVGASEAGGPDDKPTPDVGGRSKIRRQNFMISGPQFCFNYWGSGLTIATSLWLIAKKIKHTGLHYLSIDGRVFRSIDVNAAFTDMPVQVIPFADSLMSQPTSAVLKYYDEFNVYHHGTTIGVGFVHEANAFQIPYSFGTSHGEAVLDARFMGKAKKVDIIVRPDC